MTARHYSNSQNLIISFEYSWYLGKNLSYFVSLPWKLHNRKCHTVHSAQNIGMAYLMNCNPDQINLYGLQDAILKPHFKQWLLTNHILFCRREAQPLWASWQMEISKFAYSESRVTNFFYLCGSQRIEIISKGRVRALQKSPKSWKKLYVSC